MDKMNNKRGYTGIGLHNPKNSFNIGGVIRAAYIYNASFVSITGKRYKKTVTDTTKGYRHIPLFQVDNLKSIIPYDCIPIAVDLIKGAIPLPKYQHPQRAFYIFGAEDATLGINTINWCRDIIYIPTKHCMNLAACVNVVLYDRLSKTYNK